MDKVVSIGFSFDELRSGCFAITLKVLYDLTLQAYGVKTAMMKVIEARYTMIELLDDGFTSASFKELLHIRLFSKSRSMGLIVKNACFPARQLSVSISLSDIGILCIVVFRMLVCFVCYFIFKYMLGQLSKT